MRFFRKLSHSSESGFTFARGLIIAATASLVGIPVVFNGLALVLSLMTVVAVSVLVIPVVYIHSQR